jgi:hypothetical protein
LFVIIFKPRYIRTEKCDWTVNLIFLLVIKMTLNENSRMKCCTTEWIIATQRKNYVIMTFHQTMGTYLPTEIAQHPRIFENLCISLRENPVRLYCKSCLINGVEFTRMSARNYIRASNSVITSQPSTYVLPVFCVKIFVI